MTAVEQAIAEIDASLAELEPELEGFQDYDRLNITSESHGVVKDLIAQYSRRVDLLQQARARLVALMTDGHPVIPVATIPPAVYTDLQGNAGTIEAALGKVTPAEVATTLSLSVGPVEPK